MAKEKKTASENSREEKKTEPKKREIKEEQEVITAEEVALLREKAEKADEYLDKFQRTLAEYDNFRKRTLKEKEQLITEAKFYTVSALLPIMDNLERAEAAAENENEDNPLKTGLLMIIRSAKDAFANMGVEEIEALNAKFDPNFHNAVMHIEDENIEENTIVEVFQKGYKSGDKVLRPSMVKVAN